SHDLRAPLHSIAGYSELLAQGYLGLLDETGRRYLSCISTGTQQMAGLINDLIRLAKGSRAELKFQRVNLTSSAREIVERLKSSQPLTSTEFSIQDGVEAYGDRGLLTVVLENLLSNAKKYAAKKPNSRVEFCCISEDQEYVYFVRDDGAGFDMK